ncbi:MAG: hypothetical protein DRP55_04270 [Spirochaetes bacterium]|nr:MAG: hypothetical protein DRP55_04270 [Spirochaetota bacterium]
MVAHDVLTYLSARSMNFPDYMVTVTPYSYQEIDEYLYNPNYIFEYREGQSPVAFSSDPMYDETEYYSNYINYHPPKNGKVAAIEILSLYSAEPDWGMDRNLKLSLLQGLMGGSQGYRHMRYVLFLFLRAGSVSRQVSYFTKLSKIAFKRDDKYWGLRFAARAIHYLEDLLTPVHSKPFPEAFLIKNAFSPKRIYFKSFNYHMNFEKLIGYHLWHGREDLIEAIKSSPVMNLKSLNFLYSRTGHLKTRKILKEIFTCLDKIWGNRMEHNPYKLKKSEIEDSLLYENILKLSIKWLNHSSSVVKGYIKNFILPEFE